MTWLGFFDAMVFVLQAQGPNDFVSIATRNRRRHLFLTRRAISFGLSTIPRLQARGVLTLVLTVDSSLSDVAG